MATNSPLMGLPISTIGVDSGLQWEQNLNAALSRIDQHDHSSGNGNQVIPSGLNINTALSFQSQDATDLRTSRYTVQTTPVTSSAPDQGCVYVSTVGGNNELFYNDSGGAQVQLTSAGNVNATSSSLTSGTASASFISSVLVVNSATNTPANIQGRSILLGNNVAGSNFLTLSPPGAMPSSFGLVLPAIPAANAFVTLDTSGNFGTTSQSGGLVASNIASGTLTHTQLSSSAGILGTQIASGTLKQGNMAILAPHSSSAVSFSTASLFPTYANVTNAVVSLTTTGGAVMLIFQGGFLNDGSGGVYIRVVRSPGSTVITNHDDLTYLGPCGALNCVDTGVVGSPATYSYQVQMCTPSGGTVSITLDSFIAIEL